MVIAFSLVAMIVAFALIWRGYEVRAVLLATALLIGALAGGAGAVFRRAAEGMTDYKYVLPICGAMAFSYVARQTGCVDELVALLLRPIAKVGALVLPGSGFVAFVVNTAIPSQTSTLAAVGPLSVAFLANLRTSAMRAGTALVIGASISGELLNPGVPQVIAVAGASARSATELVVWLAPAGLAALLAALGALVVVLRFFRPRRAIPEAELAPPRADAPEPPAPTWRAVLPILPIGFLLAGHPSLPWHAAIAKLTPAGFEIFAVMLAGAVFTILVAARGPGRAAATTALLDGLAFAYARIVTLIAVSGGIAKALELAGVLHAFVGVASGHPEASLLLAFLLAFSLSTISGSGVGPAVALITALEPRAAELGVAPLALGGALLFGAEAGRTTSPVSAVVLFGSSLVSVPARDLSTRLLVPCFVGGVAGALVCILRA